MADRAHDMEPPFRAHGVLRLVGDLGDRGEVALAQPQDTLRIIGARDLLSIPGLVVADIGPTEHIVKHRVTEESAGKIDRACSLVRINHHGLPIGFDLMPAIGPQEGVEPAVIVTKAMAKLEAERMALRLQLLADLIQFFPSFRKLRDTDLGKPISAPVHQLADIAERERLPSVVDDSSLPRRVIPTALLLPGLFGNVAHIQQFLVEQEWEEEER